MLMTLGYPESKIILSLKYPHQQLKLQFKVLILHRKLAQISKN